MEKKMSTESILSRIPDNTNFIQETKFTFLIPNLPFATYYCQTVMLPGITTSEVMVPSPLSEMYRHGDKLVFEPLVITFLIDEDMRVWEETYKWLVSLTAPRDFKEYANKFSVAPDKYYDGVLFTNTNSNLPNLKFKFINCHPVALGGIQYNSAGSADVVPTADVTFRFDTFSIERT